MMNIRKAFGIISHLAIILPQLVLVVVTVIIVMIIFVICGLAAIAKQDI
jgi:hypothetical protein